MRAGAPDTPEIGAEVTATIEAVRGDGREVVWVDEQLERADLARLLSSCTVFCCPSVYEPFGLVNVEAMACGVPVVASDTGGIPEVVEHEETGLLVPITPGDDGTGEPADPAVFAADLAGALTAVLENPARARAMGAAGRVRVAEHFSWPAIARETLALYGALTEASPGAF